MKSVLCLIGMEDQTGHKLDGNPGLIFKQVVAEDDNIVKTILFVNVFHTAAGTKGCHFKIVK